MAANEAVWESCKDKKRTAKATEMSPDGLFRHPFQECFSSLIDSITELSSELNISPGVLKITANVSALNSTQLQPSLVYNCLQQHISKLKAISTHLKQILDAESPADSAVNEKTEKSLNKLSPASEEDMVLDRELFLTQSHQQTASKDKVMSQPDDRSVQIKAGKAEIERRISAFIERKQLENNENNVREFCNVIDCNRDAVFTPYPGFKSHVKVTRVVNTYGPQTRGGRSEQREHQPGSYSRDCGNPVIEERLQNIEAHLKLTAAGPVPQSIYQRLKKLEDRVLELEGLSPEYFHSMSYSLSEIDGKINAVRSALLKRASVFQSRDLREFPF
ncbi:MAP3K12-binding inhibitory protein 1 [Bagarius yarrelli]|uniref:MAP3K12-binding inhibitory protein 1 n=1 Tax=Bagarius yarrelli TaxID=175774 RepID=A0A556U7J8_BAGYA|nr:MAP3K12-binding inhibitory protein 1 [Bagarius yarrelli]